jgi:hypothetical protein
MGTVTNIFVHHACISASDWAPEWAGANDQLLLYMDRFSWIDLPSMIH